MIGEGALETKQRFAPGARIARCAALGALLVLLVQSRAAEAQELEPRRYANAPIGMNFLLLGYVYTSGSVTADPTLPLQNARFHTHGLMLAYSRILDVAGMSSNFAVLLPVAWATGSADYNGQPQSRSVAGLADPAMRLTVNFFGAPSLTLPELRGWQQDVIVGLTTTVSAPIGRYEDDRLLNLGTHRWAFKTEIGVSKALGRWTLEIAPALTYFTTNHDFFGGHTRAQAPIASIQGHVIYQIGKGVWVALDGTYYTGGRTTLDGELSDNVLSNSRIGATAALPLGVQHSIKVHGSVGLWTRRGTEFDTIGVAWQLRFGGGL